MDRWFRVMIVLSSVALVSPAFAGAKASDDTGARAAASAVANSGLPALPQGVKTVIGGVIGDIDPVRDQLTLDVFGGKPMKIFFDERTQIFRDGVKTPLRDLHRNDHASVETVLDGTSVFAVSIHMLSSAPEGECQGQVLGYDPGSGELSVNEAVSRQPIKLRVPAGASIVATGQAASSIRQPSVADLVNGALVSIQFESNSSGEGIVKSIAILAKPGATFVFSGNISYLDLHANQMTVVDPRDQSSYTIYFDPTRFPVTPELKVGVHVTVETNFDGTRYIAHSLEITPSTSGAAAPPKP